MLLERDCVRDRLAAGLDVDHVRDVADGVHAAVDGDQHRAERCRVLARQLGDLVSYFALVVVQYFVLGLVQGVGDV